MVKKKMPVVTTRYYAYVALAITKHFKRCVVVWDTCYESDSKSRIVKSVKADICKMLKHGEYDSVHAVQIYINSQDTVVYNGKTTVGEYGKHKRVVVGEDKNVFLYCHNGNSEYTRKLALNIATGYYPDWQE